MTTTTSAGAVTVTGVSPVTVVVSGRLDEGTGRTLVHTVGAVAATGGRRVEIDLAGVTAFDEAGIKALGVCLATGRELEQGVGIQVSSEPGRAAFLACLADV